jgi:protein-S-isoprenylcysteine O-methyltransferase Ste14
MEYLILIILWITWCVIHSAMISLTIINYLQTNFGNFYKYYRIFYNLVSLVTFIPIIHYSIDIKSILLFQWKGDMVIVQRTLLLIVIILFILGARKYDMLQLLGIRQIKSEKSHITITEDGGINTSGILSITRHPWYLATIIFVWVYNREMYVSTLIVNGILTIYLIIGTMLEERKLIIELGDPYREYKNKVSMLFPTKWIFSKLNL